MRIYNLTPMGPGWGWWSRIIEIIFQTLALLVVVPVQAFHWLLSRVLSRILP